MVNLALLSLHECFISVGQFSRRRRRRIVMGIWLCFLWIYRSKLGRRDNNVELNFPIQIYHHFWAICKVMHLSLVFFLFLVLEVHWASYICELIVFIKFGKFVGIIPSYTFLFPSFFRCFSFMYVKPLEIVPQLAVALFIFYNSFLFVFHFDLCLLCIFRFTSDFFCIV